MIHRPRFQGRAFETHAGWSWQVDVSIVGGGDDVIEVKCDRADFPTKEDAIRDMEANIQKMIGLLAEGTDMPIDKKNYVDLLANEQRKWGDEN